MSRPSQLADGYMNKNEWLLFYAIEFGVCLFVIQYNCYGLGRDFKRELIVEAGSSRYHFPESSFMAPT